MNNYCTNCGKKLDDNVIKCDKCGTYVIDLKSVNKKKIFYIIITIVIIIIVGIITSIFCYNLYFKNLHKSLNNKYLKNDYNNAEYVKYDSCYACDGSCDGACINSPKIVGCFRYYYKSSSDIETPDIVVYSNRGSVSVDAYSSIINKYGFKEDIEEDEVKYLTEKRNYLDIEVDYIDSYNIDKIYKMVNEIIDTYEKDNRYNLDIYINVSTLEESIEISNQSTSNKSIFEWNLNDKKRMSNPSLDDFKESYKQFYIGRSLQEGLAYND